MRILAIDTSTPVLCLGICDGAKIYEYNLEVGIKLSALLAPTLKRVTECLGWRMSNIDYFVCGLGPGSFTGVRVGLATIKGLAWSLNKPVVGISSLDILAKNVRKEQGFSIPVIDAKRDLIYCSVYKIKSSQQKRIMPYMLLTPCEFARKIKSKIPTSLRQQTVLLGDGLKLHKEKLLTAVNKSNILDKDFWYPQGRNLIELAKERIKAKEINTAFEIEPIYLYPKECQIRQSQKSKVKS
jgi:tRNA threonylcarbamoyl adenosine modification protein YeaZ